MRNIQKKNNFFGVKFRSQMMDESGKTHFAEACVNTNDSRFQSHLIFSSNTYMNFTHRI